jgi:hypothetical protein
VFDTDDLVSVILAVFDAEGVGSVNRGSEFEDGAEGDEEGAFSGDTLDAEPCEGAGFAVEFAATLANWKTFVSACDGCDCASVIVGATDTLAAGTLEAMLSSELGTGSADEEPVVVGRIGS